MRSHKFLIHALGAVAFVAAFLLTDAKFDLMLLPVIGAALSITAANVAPSAAATLREEFNFGATTTAGQFLYYNASTGKWSLVDIDAALGVGISDLRGIACNGGADGQPASVATYDPDFTPGATLTNGLVIYGFTTAGAISIADIPTTGGYPVVAGVTKSTTKCVLNPMSSGAVI